MTLALALAATDTIDGRGLSNSPSWSTGVTAKEGNTVSSTVSAIHFIVKAVKPGLTNCTLLTRRIV